MNNFLERSVVDLQQWEQRERHGCAVKINYIGYEEEGEDDEDVLIVGRWRILLVSLSLMDVSNTMRSCNQGCIQLLPTILSSILSG
jgi:hypothetical protein